MVEMMVVVVIILLLAAVLLPSLRNARVRAMKTASQAQLRGLTSACENYYAAFNAYPGYFSDSTVDSGTLSGNENFVLSLMGRVNKPSSGSASFPSNVDLTNVGAGPIDDKTGKIHAPYYSAKADELVVIQGTTSGPNDMPELVDTSSGMPLLMWRVSRSPSTPVAASYSGGNLYMTAVAEYVNSSGLKLPDESEVYNQASESLITTTNTNKFDNLAWAVVDPRSSDLSDNNPNNNDVVNGAYVFISPGVDGIYFSKFDLNEDGSDDAIDDKDDLSLFDDVVEIGGSR